MFGVFFTCLASFLLFNFFNVLLQTVIALENVCDHLYVKLNTWIYCQIVLFLFTCKIGDKWISTNQFEHVYLNLYIPSNLSRIKKVKVARLQTMRPSLVKLTALSGISPFTTNVCFDYWLCSTCSVTCTYWLSGIVGEDNIWLESLMTWEPLFAQSMLHDQEPIILSC